MKPYVIFVCGLPGTGKSTMADRMIRQSNYGYVSSDFFIDWVADIEGKTYGEVFQDTVNDATKYVDCSVKWYTDRNLTFVWDQTLLTEKSRERAFSKIPEHYGIYIMWFACDDETLRKRLEVRAERNGKVIPEQVINQMRSTMEEPSPENVRYSKFAISKFMNNQLVSNAITQTV